MSFYQKRKGFANPKKYPAVFHYSDRGPLTFDVLVADEPAFVGLKMNLPSFDGPALKRLPEGGTVVGTGVTVDQLKTILVAGATWREPRPALVNEPDGEKLACGMCQELKQPVKYPYIDKETGASEERGNFMELKAERLETLKEDNPEFLVAAEAHTRKVIGVDSAMPKFVRTLFVCEDCKAAERRGKSPVFRTYYSRATIADRLLERNTRIQAAVRRNVLNDALGSKRNDPRAVRHAYEKFGVSTERRGGNRRSSFGNDRSEKPKAIFVGTDGSADFEVGTTEALVKGGVKTLFEITKATNERLFELGAISSADHEMAADSVRYRARVGLERAGKAAIVATAPDLEEAEVPTPRSSGNRTTGKRTGRRGARFSKVAAQ